jgi:t-SNARE complex subunit (syntaxin)
MMELRRQKDHEFEQMRKKFMKNLNHYKDIIIKFTTKSSDSKHRESLLESTFT